jgi:hypothetical protein
MLPNSQWNEKEEKFVSHKFSSTHAIMTVKTTVIPIKAPDTRSSVPPLLAVGTGATVAEPVEVNRVADDKVESLLDRLEATLDCEAEMLDILDDATDEIEDAAEDAAELTPEAREDSVELAPDAREEAPELAPEVIEDATLDAALETDAVLIGTTMVMEDPEMTVVYVVDPVVAALAPVLVAVLLEPVVIVAVPVTEPVPVPGAITAVDCEPCAVEASDDPLAVPTGTTVFVPAVPVVEADPVAVAMGTTTLIPVVDRDTPPVFAERTEFALVSMDERAEAALLNPDVTTAPGAVSVIVIVATIADWPVQTGSVTLVM